MPFALVLLGQLEMLGILPSAAARVLNPDQDWEAVFFPHLPVSCPRRLRPSSSKKLQ